MYIYLLIATVQSKIEVQNRLFPIFSSHKNLYNYFPLTLQKGTFSGKGGGGSGLYVKVGRAIRQSKGLCTHTIGVK